MESSEYRQKIWQSSGYYFLWVYSQLHMQQDHLLVKKWDLKVKSEKKIIKIT